MGNNSGYHRKIAKRNAIRKAKYGKTSWTNQPNPQTSFSNNLAWYNPVYWILAIIKLFTGKTITN